MNKQSPYLANKNRLQDVIAAIQVLGTYKFYKLEFSKWADRITGDEKKADYWKRIFEEHPEFFRLDAQKERASLVWRRQFPKRYSVDTDSVITRENYYNLTQEEQNRISRNPLGADNIESLIKTAIDIHSRALQHQQDKRWWFPLFSAIAALIGAVVGALIGMA